MEKKKMKKLLLIEKGLHFFVSCSFLVSISLMSKQVEVEQTRGYIVFNIVIVLVTFYILKKIYQISKILKSMDYAEKLFLVEYEKFSKSNMRNIDIKLKVSFLLVLIYLLFFYYSNITILLTLILVVSIAFDFFQKYKFRDYRLKV